MLGPAVAAVLLLGCGASRSDSAPEPSDPEQAREPQPPQPTPAPTPPPAQPAATLHATRIAELLPRIDDSPDPLHADITPAVLALSDLGPPAALAVVPLLEADDRMTRLHAQRVVEGVVMRLHGFSPGRGFGDRPVGEPLARTLLASFDYDFDAPPGARSAAAARARAWLLDAGAALPPDESRARGSVRASFTAATHWVFAGDSIPIEVAVTNEGTDPLTFDVGGDYRGSFFHLRFGFVVRDEDGAVVCDTIASPPMSLGGLGTTETLAPGATHRETVHALPACRALLEPGTYRITITRTLTTGADPPAECGWGAFPDLTRGAAPSYPPACSAALADVPQVTFELSVRVFPYARELLAAGLRDLARREARDPSGGGGPRIWYVQWLCREVRCDCPDLDATRQSSPAGMTRWLAEVASGLPERIPATPCARR